MRIVSPLVRSPFTANLYDSLVILHVSLDRVISLLIRATQLDAFSVKVLGPFEVLMAVFAGQFVVTVWILSGLVLRSNARVLTKPCSGGEFIAAVNSSHLFGLPVECHDACVVLAASQDSVSACSQGMQARTGWRLCETSTPEALVLQDSEKV